jgi:hypothetical protein
MHAKNITNQTANGTATHGGILKPRERQGIIAGLKRRALHGDNVACAVLLNLDRPLPAFANVPEIRA